MPAKITTTIINIEKKLSNQTNRQLLGEFYNYLVGIDISKNYQNGLLKVLIGYAEYIGPSVTFYQIQYKEQIIKFLDSKRRPKNDDPDKKMDYHME